MASKHPLSPKVVRKAFPALVLILFIFISLVFLISYTDAFYLVILLWIIIPVLGVKAHARLKRFLAGRKT